MDPTPTVSATQATQEHRFEFTGSGGEYFRIWIVNLLLTLITLGIYGAWAKVRRLRYFHGNTLLAGSSFEYHGEPIKILKGRLIAGVILIPVYFSGGIDPFLALASSLLFLVALPFIVVRSRRFQMRMTSWRNIRFDFTGSYGEAAGIYIGKAMLTGLTLGLYYPSLSHSKYAFVIGKSKYGSTRFAFNAPRGSFYAIYGMGSLIFVAALIVAILVAASIAGPAFDFREAMDAPTSSSPSNTNTLIKVVLVLLTIAGIGLMIAKSFIQAKLANISFGNTWIGLPRLQSKLPVLPLAWLHLTNIVLIIITMGLFSPWAKIRLMRFQFENMSLVTPSSLDEFVATEAAHINATGEEMGDFLDVDFGL